MSDKFTVICPTMWLSESFPKFLPKLIECDSIDEILIINNNKRFTPTIVPHEKLKVCTPEENLGVNKSWNIGVLAAKNNKLAIINDDVVFNTDVFEYMLPLVTEDKGLVGLNLNTKGSSYSLAKTEHRYFGYACLFFIHKNNYDQIPESLKIYFGDDWLFESNKRKGISNYYLAGFKTEGELSQTSKHFYSEYYAKEKEIYNIEISKLTMNYRYSIIVPHYDGSIDDKTFIRGMYCLLNQTEQNFEVLLYHDGPVSRPIPEVYKQFGDRCRLAVTETRENDWGHSNRDRGIKSAKGDYIVHFNPDNILYHDCLRQISEIINNDKYPYNKQDSKKCLISNNIIIFPIYMNGHFRFGSPTFKAIRFTKSESSHRSIFTGDPCVIGNVDCLQLVMKRNLWLTYGGWYDKRSYGDGVMYERFVEDHGARYATSILGEHM